MSVARVLGMSLWGLEGRIVEVECEISRGLPAFVIVGLPDSSTLQARERVKSACANAGHAVGEKKVTVNLSPAWMKKSGSGFDLPIAVATLAAKGVLPPGNLESTLFVAELALDGSLRPVPGILPAVLAAEKSGVRRVVVAAANAEEARLVPGIEVRSARHLGEVIEGFGGRAEWSRRALFDVLEREERDEGEDPDTERERLDFLDVKGQKRGREAAEVAAAGGHHMLLLGPPGAGKSMIASRLPSILPPLEAQRALELSALSSIAGDFDATRGLVREAPFIAPHHTSSVASIIGGGSNLASPGAVSRAHGGVLFLDEAPEFAPKVLESLREVLETGEVSLHRTRGVATYPAAFQLVLAANPCPCGNADARGDRCRCTSMQRRRYMARLSGPIVDRLDLRLRLTPVRTLSGASHEESSADIRERVCAAREAQNRRLDGSGYVVNAQLSGRFLDQEMPLEQSDEAILVRAVERGRLTMRGRDRVRRVAWTLADLAGAARPTSAHVASALELRGEDAA
ncbi:mg chelatase-like protein [Dermabacter vaginalis]|uniref:Mg chelatase-like protein n=1 Tax=Dermabacter vaginalis TaxID=1630135 RepID=A0A1B0ZK47_9MICO|nr:YifB family Mg chelatase-like AAA ATPase [Dermabacter vaginalis]ANP28232.1 mg chelatase-like protein [Dermabacter vaginalis]